MLLAIDAGNTNTVFALFEGDAIARQWRMATDARRTSDEYGMWLLQIMASADIKPERVNSAIMASVVPQSVFELRMLCRRYFRTELMVVGDPDLKVGIEAKIDRPSEVGADRLVNSLAAWSKYKKPLVVIDFGTATTFDVVSGEGNYIGGVIAPGINLSLDTLHRAAAKLPNITIARPDKVIGTGTISAMQSGIYFGYLGLIEGIVARIRQQYGKPMVTVATGGLAPLFAKDNPVIEYLEPDLIMSGLKRIYDLNAPQG